MVYERKDVETEDVDAAIRAYNAGYLQALLDAAHLLLKRDCKPEDALAVLDLEYTTDIRPHKTRH